MELPKLLKDTELNLNSTEKEGNTIPSLILEITANCTYKVSQGTHCLNLNAIINR